MLDQSSGVRSKTALLTAHSDFFSGLDGAVGDQFRGEPARRENIMRALFSSFSGFARCVTTGCVPEMLTWVDRSG